MEKRFAILAAPRTGTNTLVDRLCAQPDVWCHGEVLQRGRVRTKLADKALKAELLELRERDLDAFLARIFALSNGRAHCGIKVLLGHLGERISIVDDAGIAKIVLFRANVLAAHASQLAAAKGGAWTPVKMQQSERPLVEFAAAAFTAFHAAYVERYRALSGRLVERGQRSFFLRTDELNETSRIAELLGFLGAATQVAAYDDAPVRGPSDILGRFSNPGDAERFLRGHGLIHWAQEGDVSLLPL
jgi:hypothetical protein